MRLYDVHTHRPPADLATPAVVSIDASEPFEPRPGGCYAVGLCLSFGLLHRPDALRTTWDRRRLFVETDDSPTPIVEVYERIAGELHVSVESLAHDVEKRFAALFP